MTDHAHTDSPTSNRVLTEQRDAARTELEAEQTHHAEMRVTVLAIMEAANAHMNGLREGIDVLHLETERLRNVAAGCGKFVLDMQAEIDRLNVAIQAKP